MKNAELEISAEGERFSADKSHRRVLKPLRVTPSTRIFIRPAASHNYKVSGRRQLLFYQRVVLSIYFRKIRQAALPVHRRAVVYNHAYIVLPPQWGRATIAGYCLNFEFNSSTCRTVHKFQSWVGNRTCYGHPYFVISVAVECDVPRVNKSIFK